MGKSAGSPPAAPNPEETAAAQTMSNLQTAQAQSTLNNVNQVTPYGSLSYAQPGGPNTPFTATTQLSPAEQANLNLSQQAQQLYGQTAINQLGQAAGSLSQPINTNWNQVQNQYLNTQMGLLQPQIAQQQQALQSQLQNQGVAQGSDAWNNAMRAQNNLVAQSYAGVLQNAQQGVGNAIQQQIALRDQPLNEAQALLSGSQVAQPQFVSTPQTQVGQTNVLGAQGLATQAQEYNYAQQVAQNSANLGGASSLLGTGLGIGLMPGLGSAGTGFGSSLIGTGLGALGIGAGAGAATAAGVGAGLGSAAFGSAGLDSLGALAFLSDERLKTDIKEVGRLMLPGGAVPLKTFRYHGDPVRRLGFVAQDVQPVLPGAVSEHPLTGIKGLNYAAVLMAAHQAAMNGGGGLPPVQGTNS